MAEIKPLKYEIKCLMVSEKNANAELEKLWKEGWEIAGEILVRNQSGHCLDNYFHIPLKRRIE